VQAKVPKNRRTRNLPWSAKASARGGWAGLATATGACRPRQAEPPVELQASCTFSLPPRPRCATGAPPFESGRGESHLSAPRSEPDVRNLRIGLPRTDRSRGASDGYTQACVTRGGGSWNHGCWFSVAQSQRRFAFWLRRRSARHQTFWTRQRTPLSAAVHMRSPKYW